MYKKAYGQKMLIAGKTLKKIKLLNNRHQEKIELLEK